MRVDSIINVSTENIMEIRHYTLIYISKDSIKGTVTGVDCKEGDTINVTLNKIYCNNKYTGYTLTTK